MEDLWSYIQETDRPIALYGTGDGADKIMAKLDKDGTLDKVQGVFASSGFVRDRYFKGFKVESFESCKERLGDDLIVLMCFGSSRPEVLENVDRIASQCEFYAPDVPVYGKNIFDKAFYEEHKSEITRVTALLEDDLSVRTMVNTVTNKLTGSISPLKECETTPEEENSLISLAQGSTFVDLGAYNGDTVLKYTSLCPGIDKIFAVEPDKRNFRKLKENTSHIEGITYINALISDKSGATHIDLSKGRGVHEAKEGGDIESTTVDDILQGQKVDFIKFDVEGNEKKAIHGASESIKKYRPVMHMACYHRSEDIFDLPLEVLKIRSDYKVYMRHLPHVPGWDTAFIFV